jgi:hypothetical protein
MGWQDISILTRVEVYWKKDDKRLIWVGVAHPEINDQFVIILGTIKYFNISPLFTNEHFGEFDYVEVGTTNVVT